MKKILAWLLTLALVLSCCPILPLQANAQTCFTQVTDVSQLVSGQYVMILDTGYAPGVLDGTWISAVQPTVSGDTITDAEEAVWVLTFTENGVILTDFNGVSISPKGGNTNGIITGDYEWNWSFADGKVTFAGVGDDTVVLASNTDAQYGNKLRAYKSTTVTGAPDKYPSLFTLYLVGECADLPEIPDASEAPETSDAPEAPEASDAPEAPEAPNESVKPNVPVETATPEATATPNTPVEPEEPTTPAEPETPTVPTTVVELVYAPDLGVAYKFAMNQVNLEKVLGITGEMDNYYYATSEVVDEMADVYLENAAKGYHIYLLRNDVKTYLNIIPRDNDATKVNVVMQTLEENAAPSDYSINNDYKYVWTTVNGTDWYMGTYGTYKTVSASKTTYIEDTSKIGVSQFPAWFATVATVEVPVEPEVPEVPETPEVPEDPETPEVPEEPVGNGVTITFDDIAKRVTLTDDQQVWQENGITVTNNKGASTTNVNGKYFNPVRFYKSSDVIVEYPGMIRLDVDTSYTTYVDALVQSLEGMENIDSITTDGNVVSIALIKAVDSFAFTASAGQCRANTITVYAGEGTDTPVEPEDPTTPAEPEDPTVPGEDGAVLTIEEAIAMGSAMEHNTYTEVNYKVTGVISEVYNTTFGNMRLTDDAGNILTIYGTYDETGKIRYDAMEVKPVAGDTVTIYGPVGQYNGTPQIKNGWIVEHIPAQTEPEDPSVPEEPETPAAVVELVYKPEAGLAYKFVMNQVNLGKVLGITGEMSGFYYATSEVVDEMADVYVENAENGFHIYFLRNDVKTYLNIIPRDNDATKVNVVMQTLEENAAPSAYHMSIEYKYVYTTVNDVDWYLGTYNTFNTVSASKTTYIEDTSKIGVSQFPAWFATAEASEEPEDPTVPEDPTTPEEPEDPTVPGEDGAVLTIEEAIAMGSAMEHNTYTEVNYKVTGVISEVYNLVYGNMKLIDEAGNILTIYGTFDATGENRYDAMEVKPVAGDTVTIYGPVGQYNGTPQIKNGWIIEHIPGEDQPEEPEVPETVVDFVYAPVAGVPYKFVLEQVALGKALGFTGEMSGFYYATSEVAEEMADVYLEEAEGGYRIYCLVEGVKTYLNIIPRDNDATKVNVVLQTIAENAAPSVYVLNVEFRYVYTTVNGADWYLGTYGTYQTISASKTTYIEDTSKIGVSQFPVWFAVSDTEIPEEPENPEVTVGDIDGNQQINVDDAIYLLQYVLMPSIFPIDQPADFNKDGFVNEDDAIYLLQHVLMPEVFPL